MTFNSFKDKRPLVYHVHLKVDRKGVVLSGVKKIREHETERASVDRQSELIVI